MLILTRRIGETIVIGDDVKVCVLEVNGGQVRLGIDAPRNMAVHREEVHARIQKEQGGGPVPAKPTTDTPEERAAKHKAQLEKTKQRDRENYKRPKSAGSTLKRKPVKEPALMDDNFGNR